MPLVNISGKSEQGLFLGDQQLQLVVPTESILSMFLISNVWLIGPTFDMLILDAGGAVLNPMPADGMKLKVFVGDSINPSVAYDFLCIGSPVAEATPKGPAIRISAILDAPKLYHGVCRTTVNDTSSSAITKLAQECGLVLTTSDANSVSRVDSSQGDSMKWLPMGRKYGYFLADIASRGWFGDSSAASVVGVTLAKQVVYRDLAKAAKQKPIYHFYHGLTPPQGDNNCFIAHSMAREDHFTVGVGQAGYAASRSRFTLDGSLEKHTDINVTQINERLNISTDIKKAVTLSRAGLAPLDCGNTHANYDKAGYQNARYRATFSRQISIVVQAATNGPDLLDAVVVHYIDAKTQTAQTTVGLISGKTISILNGFYVERFNVAYQGEDGDVISG